MARPGKEWENKWKKLSENKILLFDTSTVTEMRVVEFKLAADELINDGVGTGGYNPKYVCPMCSACIK